ncbi:aminotransferase class V-fold PLP-dependent enzyme [Maridesulfovibrio sp.]|uniref:aminotransferase class V-fold PLP-dependent enzyme n=1 Tax=Maridesulfovibrio sp. TaxID=2795000 RepID=UPI0029CAA4BC|nr:aminotransferase class V-fold PLP-dependent enzyme [Maridesulfovibrio sp.]
MKFSRREFLSAGLGLGSVLIIPDFGLATDSPKTDTGSPATTKVQALKEIEAFIQKCATEGKQFSADKLAADNNAQWDRLVNHYFDRKKYTCLSVNSANLCPSMKPVQDMVDLVQDMLAKDISFPMRGELAEASLGHGLEAMKKWFGLEKQKYEADYLMALVANSTQGNNFINNGLVTSGFFDPQKDNVVVWDVNHPTNYQAWEYRRATQGWAKDSVRVVRTKMFANSVTASEAAQGILPGDPANEDEIIKAILTKVDKNTKVVTLSWQSNECGILLPMARIVNELRKINKHMHIHADSAQTLGVLDLKLGDLDVDSITGSYHKWPCGPKMVGVLYMNNKTGAAERFVPSEWGYDEHIMTPEDYGFKASSGQIDPNAKRFSYLGQQNDATLVSTWMAALFHTGKFHPQVNPEKIEKRIHYLGSRAKEALLRKLPDIYPDFKTKYAYKWISTPTNNDNLRSSVFLFKTPDKIKAGDVVKNVYEQHQIAIANLHVLGHDLVRISPTFCNTAADVEDAVGATVDVIKAMIQGKLANNTVNRSYA